MLKQSFNYESALSRAEKAQDLFIKAKTHGHFSEFKDVVDWLNSLPSNKHVLQTKVYLIMLKNHMIYTEGRYNEFKIRNLNFTQFLKSHLRMASVEVINEMLQPDHYLDKLPTIER